jgi:hypothetical protein
MQMLSRLIHGSLCNKMDIPARSYLLRDLAIEWSDKGSLHPLENILIQVDMHAVL